MALGTARGPLPGETAVGKDRPRAVAPVPGAGSRHRQRWAHVLLYKAFAELRVDAEKYYVGYLWWVVEPIIDMAVWYIVFAQLLHRGTEDFVAFLLCGLIVWRWFSVTLLKGSTSIVTNRALAMQVFVPKIMFPLVAIVVSTAKFAIVLAALAVFLNLYGIRASWWYAAIPLLLIVQVLFMAAVTTLAAAVVPFVPSLQVILDTALRIGFALSGIFFPVDRLPPAWRWWLSLNPMVPLLEGWRDVLMYQRAPNGWRLAMIAVASLPVIALGHALIRRNEYTYPRLTQ
jgi:lipopolysaccharide transport system permease protein